MNIWFLSNDESPNVDIVRQAGSVLQVVMRDLPRAVAEHLIAIHNKTEVA